MNVSEINEHELEGVELVTKKRKKRSKVIFVCQGFSSCNALKLVYANEERKKCYKGNRIYFLFFFIQTTSQVHVRIICCNISTRSLFLFFLFHKLFHLTTKELKNGKITKSKWKKERKEKKIRGFTSK